MCCSVVKVWLSRSARLFYVLSIMCGLYYGSALSADECPAGYIDGLHNEILNDYNNDSANIYNAVEGIIKSNLDVERISKFVMGRYWATLSANDKKEFVHEYGDSLIHTYSDYVVKYIKYDMNIVACREISPSYYGIKVRLDDGSQNTTTVVYKVIKEPNDGSFKLIDVSVTGVSLAAVEREDFAEKMKKGNIASIIANLKQENLNNGSGH